MSDHVSQPVAALLKAAGWDGETAFIYRLSHEGEWELTYYPHGNHNWKRMHPTEWLPRASIGELRERLTLDDFQYYYESMQRSLGLIQWLYTVTASADELASIWMWANKKGE